MTETPTPPGYDRALRECAFLRLALLDIHQRESAQDEADIITNIDTDAAAEIDADHAALFAGWDSEDAECHERAEIAADQAADDEDAKDDAEWVAEREALAAIGVRRWHPLGVYIPPSKEGKNHGN